jgi:osmotically-inducible protein OsmY
MADYRRHYEEGHEPRSWFGDDTSRQRRGNDERDDRYPYGGQREDRASRWEGSYRTDDRDYHDRYRSSSRYGQPDAAEDYYRAARDQREDFLRWEAQSPGAEFEHHERSGESRPWMHRERGGYWRQYEDRAPYAGRGPKNYQRSDDRIQEEICDCMTDDPMLDASDIEVHVSTGVVTLTGTVLSRDQKRRAEDVAERVSGVKDVTNQLRVSREANGHSHAAPQPVAQSFGSATPGKSTSGNSA